MLYQYTYISQEHGEEKSREYTYTLRLARCDIDDIVDVNKKKRVG